MSQISFDQTVAGKKVNESSNSSIKFFSLKNDKDEAIVKFLYDDNSQFEIFKVHPVGEGKLFRQVNCLRETNEPLDKCPLCKSGAKIADKFIVRLLQYTPQPDGTMLVEPKIWVKSVGYASELNNLITNYGPMRNYVCKIIRNGVAGDKSTRYTTLPLSGSPMYPSEKYPYQPELFGDYKPLGRAIMNKKFDDLQFFVENGSFPQTQTQTDNTFTNIPSTPIQQPVTNMQPVASNTPLPTTVSAGTEIPPWMGSPTMAKPERTY